MCLTASPIRPSARAALIDAGFTVLNRDLSASLAEVAEAAGVGRATLHRHFSSRAELIRALALTAIEETNAASNEVIKDATSYGDALRRIFTALVPLADRYDFLTREPIEDYPDVTEALGRQGREMEALIEAARKEGVFGSAVPTPWIARSFDYLLYAAAASVKAGETTVAQAADLAWRTFTIGLGATGQPILSTR